MAAEPSAPKPPPHLRASNPDDQGGECETCTYFDHGHCTAFPPLCVDEEWVCDHYKDSGRPDDDAKRAQPKTLRGAAAKARGMMREANQQEQ